MKKRTGTYPLRLPALLKAALAETSKEASTSINQLSAREGLVIVRKTNLWRIGIIVRRKVAYVIISQKPVIIAIANF